MAGKVVVKNGKAEPAPGDAPAPGADAQGEMLTLLRFIGEGVSKLSEVCDLMLKKMEEKGNDSDTDETPPEDGSGKPAEETPPEKAMSERLGKLEASFEKVVKTLQVISGKLK